VGATGTSGIKIIIGKQLLVLISGFAEKTGNNTLCPARYFFNKGASLYLPAFVVHHDDIKPYQG